MWAVVDFMLDTFVVIYHKSLDISQVENRLSDQVIFHYYILALNVWILLLDNISNLKILSY